MPTPSEHNARHEAAFDATKARHAAWAAEAADRMIADAEAQTERGESVAVLPPAAQSHWPLRWNVPSAAPRKPAGNQPDLFHERVSELQRERGISHAEAESVARHELRPWETATARDFRTIAAGQARLERVANARTPQVALVLDAVQLTGKSAHPLAGQLVSDLVRAVAVANGLVPAALQRAVNAYSDALDAS